MKVLAVGSHPDDIELGCAATLLRHVACGDEVTMLVMTSGERGPQGEQARVREQEAAARVIGAELLWGGFADGCVPHGRETVTKIDAVVRYTGADVIYTHAPDDTHQDHLATSRGAIAAGRKVARVLCYQSPTTTSFNPNFYVDVTDTLEGKLQSLRAHRSQVERCDLVDLEAIAGGARFWGHRAGLRLAEAFQAPRFVWDIADRTATGMEADASATYPPLRVVGDVEPAPA